MILGLTTLSDANIERVLETPVLIWRVVAPDEPELAAAMMAQSRRVGWFARLLGRRAAEPQQPEAPPELEWAEGERHETDLDKAWHGIHFLLTGSDWGGDPPLDFLVKGGTEVGDVDVGYGPARVFRAAEVAAIDAALAEVDGAELHGRFDPQAMVAQDIYPSIWEGMPEDDDVPGYLVAYHERLREFVGHAARAGLGLVVTVT
jgi:hypothetical protein